MVHRSTSYSLALAAAYGLVAAAYIVVSSSIAADHSRSIEELRRIETTKGVVYVVVTMLAVFFGGWWAMRRMERDAEELLRRERALVVSQGRVFAGVMAASVAHDANNILTAVLADLEQMSSCVTPDSAAPLSQLQASVGRLVALNRRLANAHRPTAQQEVCDVDVARVVRDSLATVRAHRSLVGCRIVCRGAESLPCVTQPLLVHQIVTNLVINAGEATGGRGAIEVRVEPVGERVCIEVHDNGPGVPAERRAGLFDSLHSTKPNGSGLGLFSVRACVQGLGGDVQVDGSPLGGACLRVAFPVAKRTVAVA